MANPLLSLLSTHHKTSPFLDLISSTSFKNISPSINDVQSVNIHLTADSTNIVEDSKTVITDSIRDTTDNLQDVVTAIEESKVPQIPSDTIVDTYIKNLEEKATAGNSYDIWVDGRGDREFEVLLREQEVELRRVWNALVRSHLSLLDENEVESAVNFGLYKAFNTYKPDKGVPFPSWFYTVARNEILMASRRQRAFRGGDKATVSSIDIDPEMKDSLKYLTNSKDNVDRTCQARDVLKLVDDFIEESKHKRFRECIDLRIRGYNTTEIGKALNISQPQVSRILKAFRENFLHKYPELKEYIKSL